MRQGNRTIKNVAKDEFEKKAAVQLKEGKGFYKQIVELEGRPYLCAMTPVSVMMQKCVLWHPYFADAPKVAAVGTIS